VLDRVLRRFRELILVGDYVMSVHAQEEMEDDGLTVLDIESCILTGAIVERQRDRRTGEWKYVVQGKSLSGEECVVVGKLAPGGKCGLLTVYVLKG
jgi:hypothetical protein